ncbi:hypothetical protein GCM10011581_16340 [Saccharopolyspora subtropica]|uniref:Uncharacterized protein n=1 Tax=Saccharopolyspora thermophila TaxID=89367 RepID=A0A917JQB5_9PSEU|nr:hypothetical protein GCM10011581_16340 [Saccharopolyspora subtropica]
MAAGRRLIPAQRRSPATTSAGENSTGFVPAAAIGHALQVLDGEPSAAETDRHDALLPLAARLPRALADKEQRTPRTDTATAVDHRIGAQKCGREPDAWVPARSHHRDISDTPPQGRWCVRGGRRSADHGLDDQWNWAASVEPASAVVEESGFTAVLIRSK